MTVENVLKIDRLTILQKKLKISFAIKCVMYDSIQKR